jgi:hypothetical protein
LKTAKIGPINHLIWIDQINGMFLTLNILSKLFAIAIPVPLENIFGKTFCEWYDLPGSIYLMGSYVWSCLTAVYRLIYIVGSNWMKKVFGEKELLNVMLVVGLVLHSFLAVWVATFDPRNSSEKLCGHHSNAEIAVLNVYHASI